MFKLASGEIFKRVRPETVLDFLKHIDTKSIQVSASNVMISEGKSNELRLHIFNRTTSTKYDLFNYITDNPKSYIIMERHQLEHLAGRLMLIKKIKYS